MEKIIEKILSDSLSLKESFIRENTANLISLAEKVSQAFTKDRKLLLAGNGGSAADAQHLAAEFVNRFIMERPPLPAISLTTDTSILTSIGNDYAFEEIFSKQIKAFGTEGDVLLLITTSGNSKNLLQAAKNAREQGIYTAGFLGNNGGRLARLVDLPILVKSDSPPRVQEVQILAGHILCHLVDYLLFQKHLPGAL